MVFLDAQVPVQSHQQGEEAQHKEYGPNPDGEHDGLDLAFAVEAELADALGVAVAGVAEDLVALTHDVVRAVLLRAALRRVAVRVRSARLVARQEVHALRGRTTARQALEVIITCVAVKLLAVQTHTRVRTRISTAAKCCVDALLI